jgi:hypothetical protein
MIFERLGDGDGFARIRSRGDEALFSGLSTRQMKARLGVSATRAVADFLPTVTIKAKDLASEITTHDTNERDLRTEPAIAREHVQNDTEIARAGFRAVPAATPGPLRFGGDRGARGRPSWSALTSVSASVERSNARRGRAPPRC